MITLVTGCKESADLEWTQARSQASIKGQFLTQDPDTINFPVKVLFAIDCSLSMGQEVDGNQVGADPSGERIKAVKAFIDEYNVNDSISFDILLWSTSVFDRAKDGADATGFTKNSKSLTDVLARYRNDTQTDYLGTLAEIYTTIQKDIQLEKSSNAENVQRSKYIVIFLSDGIPQENGTAQDDGEITDQVQAIREMTEVAGVGGFAFHTFLLLGGFAEGSDPKIKAYAEQVLGNMANAGDGTYNQFENAEAISFLSFIDLRLSVEYLLKYVIAYNMNTKPGTELIHLDTDGDGLSDAEELAWYSDPTLRDTDDDGVSDYVEYTLTTPDHVFNPRTFLADPDGDGPMEMNVQDNNCTAGIGGIWPDTDQDLLTDCEEDLIGTDRRVADTDGDGIPDGLEFFAGTNYLHPEDTVDTDLDGFPNPIEIRQHTNVSSDDPKLRERYAYIYSLTNEGKVLINQGTGSGQVQSVRKLFTLGVDNLDIMDVGVNPLTNKPYVADDLDYVDDLDDVDFVAGENTIQVFIAQVPADNPDSSPYFSKVEFKVNIKSEKNESGTKVMEFHSDELLSQASEFSLPLNEMN